MAASAVAVDRLSKVYRIYASPWDRLGEALLGRPCHREYHALKDVSFEVPAGEGFGIVGENGAGKSTLLKILAGITAPTSGRARVAGKVASILELGSGFHPEFTGRQNIVLNAAMLGLSESEVEERLPAIVGFSELGSFIDQPVKTYSTGMSMRLGFSIATQVDPEILIIDEALSVGDGYFQKKCLDRLLELQAAGKTLLFCSHAMYYVSALCQRALWLRHGEVAGYGPVIEVVRRYEDFLVAKGRAAEAGTPPPAAASHGRILAARPLGAPPPLSRRDPWGLEVEWEMEDPDLPTHLAVGIDRKDGVQVCSFATHRDGLAAFVGARRYRARLTVPELPVVKGEFDLYVFLLDGNGLHVYDQRLLPGMLRVESQRYEVGLLEADHHWERGGEGEAGAVPAAAAATVAAERWAAR